MIMCVVCNSNEAIKEFQIKGTNRCIDCLEEYNTLMMLSHSTYYGNNIKKLERK